MKSKSPSARKQNKISKRGDAIKTNPFIGHFFGLLTIIIWSLSFSATDTLLERCTPNQLLAVRLALGFVALLIIRPKIMKFCGFKAELQYMVAGVCGFYGYYFLVNIAVQSGGPTNTSVITSCVPLVTIMLMCIWGWKRKLMVLHRVGFVVALVGIFFVLINGKNTIDFTVGIKFLGSAVAACVCWAIYSLLLDLHVGKNGINVARRMVFWALVVAVPIMLKTDGLPDWEPLIKVSSLIALAIVGVFGSGICYAMWHSSVKNLGVDIATNYMYLQPAVTMAASVFILKQDSFSPMSLAGMALVLIGMLLSDIAG